MRDFIKKIAILCLLVMGPFILFTSCMPGGTQPSNSYLQIGVWVKNARTTLTAGQDSLTLTRVRFIHGKSSFVVKKDSTILLTGRARQLTFPTKQVGKQALIYDNYIVEAKFQGLVFKIVRAKSVENNRFFDPSPDFTDGGNYALIIDGTFNNHSFTFKATKKLVHRFEFKTPLTLEGNNEAYQLLITADAKNWFKKDKGTGFLDPTLEKNKKAIYKNIKSSFHLKRQSTETNK